MPDFMDDDENEAGLDGSGIGGFGIFLLRFIAFG